MGLLDDMIPAPIIHRNWSPLQESIFSAIRSSPSNLIIEAVAGSGKSTTILECMNICSGNSIFLAFNKAIADDLRSRVRGAEVKTLNGLGHAVVTRHLPGVRLESYKVSNIVRSMLNTDEYIEYGAHSIRMISLAKACAFGIINDATKPHFMSLIDQFEIDVPMDRISKASQCATLAFARAINDFTAFDFDDQLFFPIYHNWSFPLYDNVFVDECQDLNAIQHLMLDKLASTGSRVVAVGDTRQAIYGFRGATHDSMASLKHQFNMTELPLSITYRCDANIVALAQTIVPQITARPSAPPGVVCEVDSIPITTIPSDSMVVCRNNAPLFGLAMQAIVANRPVRMLSNFTETLRNFIKSFKARDLASLLSKVDAWTDAEIAKAEERGFQGKIAFLSDKRECVHALAAGARDTEQVLEALERLTQSRNGPILATIHKAKGLEAPIVYILERTLIPSKFASTEAALMQEENLLYVAITRAQHSLNIHRSEA